MRVNQGLKPPNGPHFPVAPGVTLEAHTFEILYSMITEYRLRQGIPLGDVVRDVDNYVCSKWPNACLEETGNGPTAYQRAVPMANRVATWASLVMQKMPQGGYLLVGDDTAKERAGACRICPYNKPWKTGCAPCNGSSEAILSTVRKLRSVNFDSALLGCEITGHDNNTAVFMPDKIMQPTDQERTQLPQVCWKRNL